MVDNVNYEKDAKKVEHEKENANVDRPEKTIRDASQKPAGTGREDQDLKAVGGKTEGMHDESRRQDIAGADDEKTPMEADGGSAGAALRGKGKGELDESSED